MNELMLETLQSGGEVTFTVTGVSMLPMLRDGLDRVVLVQPQGRLHKHDVAFYRRRDGQFVLHRVMCVCPDSYVMCGDNQVGYETGIADTQVLAVMKGYYRDGVYHPCGDTRDRRYCRRMQVRRFFRRWKGRAARVLRGR